MTDLTNTLQTYLRAMKADYSVALNLHEYAGRAGSLEAVLEAIVSEVECNADPKTIEGAALVLNAQIKAHTDAVA